MVVVIDLILGSFAERFGDVTVEIKILHLVAQVPEVKVSLQLLDSNETLRQLRMVIGVPRGTLGCGLLDQSAYLLLVLADNLGEGCDIAVREIQTVTHPVVGLLAGVVGADGGRRLHPVAKLVYELIHPVVANNHRIRCEGTKDLRDGGFAVNMRVRLEGREKVFPAARNGEGILHMVGSEGALSTMGYLHLEAG